VNEHRVRLTDDQLKFLLHCLKELAGSYDERRQLYKQWKKAHEKDFDRTEFRRANTAFSETKQEQTAVDDMIRRFEAILSGGRPRSRSLANLACAMVVGREQENA